MQNILLKKKVEDEIHYKKNQYYLRILRHGSESVCKFNITYKYYLQTTLPTNIIALPTNYYPRITITY